MKEIHKWGLKKIASAIALLSVAYVLSGCATTRSIMPTTTCEQPEGYEYICYSNEECTQYIKGYTGVLLERLISGMYDEEDGKQKTTVYINLFYDHLNVYLIGTLSAEVIEYKGIYLILDAGMYDMDCKLLKKVEQRGYIQRGK